MIVDHLYWEAKLGTWKSARVGLMAEYYTTPKANVVLAGMRIFPDTTYNFDIVSPANNYRWHLKIVFENHTCEYRGIQNYQVYVNGKPAELRNKSFFYLRLPE